MPLHSENAEVEADDVDGQDNGPAIFTKQMNPKLLPIRRLFRWFYFLSRVQASPKGSNPV